MSEIQVYTVNCGPIDTASYIIANGSKALVVDPADAQKIIQTLDDKGLTCDAILLTHGHFDHILGADGIRVRFGCPAIIGKDDSIMLTSPMLNCSQGFFGYPCTVEPAEILADDGDELEYAGMKFTVMASPGHTKGGVCYVFDSLVFAGDTLFYLGVGRTDLLGGNMAELRSSIKRLYTLPDEMTVYPGHSEPTTIGFEAKNNPYVRR